MLSMALNIHYYDVLRGFFFLHIGKVLHLLRIHADQFDFPAKLQGTDYSSVLCIL